MNILMLNPVHPSVPHISGVRAWRFAQELALLGHRVILLTAPTQTHPAGSVSEIGEHDWSNPLVMPCGQHAGPLEDPPANLVLRKVATAVGLLRNGGAASGWCASAVRFVLESQDVFNPHVLWCTFGKGEAVVAAKRCARLLARPWVLDIKDNWELYVPRGLRHLMAKRIKGWTYVTANAQLTANMAAKWQKTKAKIIYSGVESTFYPSREDMAPGSAFILNLVGGVYSSDHLEQFMEGVGLWHKSLSTECRKHVLFRYMGSDVARVEVMARKILPLLQMDLCGYAHIDDFARKCLQAGANAYIAHKSGFHHKLLELLATSRPVIAFPDEREESIELANAAGASLEITATSQDLANVLSRLHSRYRAGASDSATLGAATRAYSWASQAQILEQVLGDAINRHEQYE